MKVMDQGTQPTVHEPEDMEEKADLQEREIEGIRDNLGDLLGELDRRRQRISPRVLIRSHPVSAAALGIVVATTVGVTLALYFRRRRQSTTLSARVPRLAAVLRRTLGTQDQLSPPTPSTGERILTAVSTAVAATATRQLLKRYFARSQ